MCTPTRSRATAGRCAGGAPWRPGAWPGRGFTPAPGPLPDDGRHEWLGLVPPDSMPRWELGPNDFVVNGNNLPVGSPYPEPFTRYEFMQDRAARMAQRLAGDASVT